MDTTNPVQQDDEKLLLEAWFEKHINPPKVDDNKDELTIKFIQEYSERVMESVKQGRIILTE